MKMGLLFMMFFIGMVFSSRLIINFVITNVLEQFYEINLNSDNMKKTLFYTKTRSGRNVVPT